MDHIVPSECGLQNAKLMITTVAHAINLIVLENPADLVWSLN